MHSTNPPRSGFVLRHLPHLALALCLAVGALVSAAPAPAPSERTPYLPVAQPSSGDFTMFTLNVAHTLSANKARQDIDRALTMGADAGGFQEFSGDAHRTALRELTAARNWGYYMPEDGNWGGSIPIVWNRSRFTLIEGRKVLVHDRQGGDPARHVNSVRLRENATGKVFGVINAHTISGGSHDAQPHDQSGDNSKTPRLRRHIAVLKSEIKRMHALTEHVVAVGDLNINYNADVRRKVAGFPTRTLGPLVEFNMPLGQASFGNPKTSKSLLDYNMSVKPKKGSGFVPRKNWIQRGFHSDHDAVVARYRVVDLLATGPVLNRPSAKPWRRALLLDRMTRVVQNTEARSQLRVVTQTLSHKKLANALRAAAARGVAVQVILDNRRATGAEHSLVAALGSDQSAASWVKVCSGSCGTSKGELQPTYLLASATGGARNLVLHTGGTLAKAGKKRWSDGFIVTDASVYGGYVNAFARMAAGLDQRNAVAGVRLGGYRVAFRPVTDGGRDTVNRIFKRIRCGKARSPRNKRKRTDVLIAMDEWSGKRGKQVARKVVKFHRKKRCNVKVVVGQKTKKSVRRVLKRGGVPLRRAKHQMGLVLVDGHYGSRKNEQVVWTGSQRWTGKGLRGEGVTLQVDRRKHVLTHRKNFNRMWKQGKRA